MPSVIEPELIHVDELPGVWSPVQWELTPEERVQEVEAQAIASLLTTVDIPEAILRLLLREVDVERTFEPPKGYDPEQQGEWDPNLVTFQFKLPIRLERVQREADHLYVEYRLADRGYWGIDVTPDSLTIQRL
jgi:hypothetical protein